LNAETILNIDDRLYRLITPTSEALSRTEILNFEHIGTQVGATPAAGENLPQKKFEPPIGAIIGSILGVIAWLIFILVYALYWSKNYSLFQNIIVTIVSFLIFGLLIGLMWVVWGFRSGWKWGGMNWNDEP